MNIRFREEFTDERAVSQMPRRTIKRRRSSRKAPRRSGFRKRVFKRRNGRRFSRKRYGSTTGRFTRIGANVTTTCLKVFKYIDVSSRTMAIGGTAFGTWKTYYLNSLFQPNAGVAGPTNIPLLSEMCSMWGACKVMATKITVKFMVAQTSLSTFPVLGYIMATPYGQSAYPASSTLLSWQNCEQYLKGNPRYCKYKYIGSPSGNSPGTVIISKYFNNCDFFGNRSEYDGNNLFDQPIPVTGGSTLPAANPTQTLGIYCGFAVMDGNNLSATTTTCFMEVQMKFYTKWWLPKQQIN